jgi:hypothetical protein
VRALQLAPPTSLTQRLLFITVRIPQDLKRCHAQSAGTRAVAAGLLHNQDCDYPHFKVERHLRRPSSERPNLQHLDDIARDNRVPHLSCLVDYFQSQSISLQLDFLNARAEHSLRRVQILSDPFSKEVHMPLPSCNVFLEAGSHGKSSTLRGGVQVSASASPSVQCEAREGTGEVSQVAEGQACKADTTALEGRKPQQYDCILLCPNLTKF